MEHKNVFIADNPSRTMSFWWDRIYSGELHEIPWDIGEPSDELVELIEGDFLKVYRALDICCGTGTEAVYLAHKGFDVSGIDISRKAIGIARKKGKESGLHVNFVIGDVLELPYKKNTFDFVNDRGCFHTIPPHFRNAFSQEVSRVLRFNGVYFMRCFSDKEPGNYGPYRISERVIKETFGTNFDIISIDDFKIKGKKISHAGYKCLLKNKV